MINKKGKVSTRSQKEAVILISGASTFLAHSFSASFFFSYRKISSFDSQVT